MFKLNVSTKGFQEFRYDKKHVKKTLRAEAGQVRNLSRKLLGRRAISEAGEFPGLRTGLFRRSIKTNVLKKALAVVIEPQRKVLEAVRGKRDAGYPWMLAAGVGRNREKRDDPVHEALERRASVAREAIRKALQTGLQGR